MQEDLAKRIGYLEGLVKGLDLEGSSEGKIFQELTGILSQMADSIKEIKGTQARLEEYIESIDEDMEDLENEVYGTEEIELECPECHEVVTLDDDAFAEDDDVDIVCPRCNTVMYTIQERDKETRKEEGKQENG